MSSGAIPNSIVNSHVIIMTDMYYILMLVLLVDVEHFSSFSFQTLMMIVVQIYVFPKRTH